MDTPGRVAVAKQGALYHAYRMVRELWEYGPPLLVAWIVSMFLWALCSKGKDRR